MEKRDVVDKILQIIKRRGGKAYKTDGDYKPDIFGCYKGRTLCIECKDRGKKKNVSEGQAIELENWRRAGALALATDDPNTIDRLLDTIDALAQEGDIWR